ncbi:TlpA disulfide reductase family protein [Mucilaginibacter aquatilis]|uniref:Redoxin domain-containing protein n=1 Tax=Mucilaginibacter aquatilis TaxID=1517760 RepID=A0A6I4I5X5_9SPHI|nr:TlpA disulfide reductase family protein [Mucilaginibacter aquatilis]MVN90267.1 redoxin domain-containing protein [Mucilaginibacter aquatilis]
MKKILLTALAALPVATMAQTGAFTVKGKIGKVDAPAKAYVQYRKDGKLVVDSAMVKNGEFEFKGTVAAPSQGYVLLSKKGDGMNKVRDYQQIYFESGVINITNAADSLGTATVTGTPTNAENEAYKVMNKPVTALYAEMNAKAKATPAADRQKPEFKKEMEAMEKKADEQSDIISRKFVKQYPKSLISLNLIGNMAYGMDYAEIAPLYAALAPSVKDSESGKKLGDQLAKMKVVAIGAVAPEFAMADTTGAMVKLSSFRGKYVLVDLWASWCGPCRQENPNVVRTFNKYKDRNFTVLGVSLDRPDAKDKWLAAIKKDGLTWTHVSDLKFWDNEVAKAWGVRAIPQNFLLDPNGKVIAKNLRGDALDAKLGEILTKAEKVKAE